jgi:hypothetical protein
MNSFAAIVVLLGLFWLVFSIVGLHVFGALPLAPPGWPNCDTLINSAVLNFHVRGLRAGGRKAGALTGKLGLWAEAALLWARASPSRTPTLRGALTPLPPSFNPQPSILEPLKTQPRPRQTLNLENYEMTMFTIIRASNYGAAAYFMSWIVLGKFILLALFLAVMLEAFENKYQVRGEGPATLRPAFDRL